MDDQKAMDMSAWRHRPFDTYRDQCDSVQAGLLTSGTLYCYAPEPLPTSPLTSP